MTNDQQQPRPLRAGMTLTAGGRTWEILQVKEHVILFVPHAQANVAYEVMDIELAAMLPWEEPVGEWVTEEEWDTLLLQSRTDDGKMIDCRRTARNANALLTRKYGQPPKEGK